MVKPLFCCLLAFYRQKQAKQGNRQKKTGPAKGSKTPLAGVFLVFFSVCFLYIHIGKAHRKASRIDKKQADNI